MSIGTRRVCAALAAFAVTFALAGCGSDQPAAAPDPKTEQVERERSTPPPPPFDECDLLTPDEVAAAEDSEATYAVSARSAQPSGDGWKLTCGYFEEGAVGAYGSSLEIQTEVDAARLEQPKPEEGARIGKPKPLDDLGDEAYAVTTYRDYTAEKLPWTDDVHVLEGDTSLLVRLHIPDGSKPAPDRAVELARKAVERLPDSIDVTPERVEGACADIDRELAAEVLGEPLVGARGLVGDGAEVACGFRGERASLDVSTSSDPDLMFQLEDLRSYAEQVPGVGDEAYAPAPPLNEVLIRVDKRLIFVNGIHSKQQSRQPNQDEIALLGNIVDAVG